MSKKKNPAVEFHKEMLEVFKWSYDQIQYDYSLKDCISLMDQVDKWRTKLNVYKPALPVMFRKQIWGKYATFVLYCKERINELNGKPVCYEIDVLRGTGDKSKKKVNPLYATQNQALEDKSLAKTKVAELLDTPISFSRPTLEQFCDSLDEVANPVKKEKKVKTVPSTPATAERSKDALVSLDIFFDLMELKCFTIKKFSKSDCASLKLNIQKISKQAHNREFTDTFTGSVAGKLKALDLYANARVQELAGHKVDYSWDALNNPNKAQNRLPANKAKTNSKKQKPPATSPLTADEKLDALINLKF